MNVRCVCVCVRAFFSLAIVLWRLHSSVLVRPWCKFDVCNSYVCESKRARSHSLTLPASVNCVRVNQEWVQLLCYCYCMPRLANGISAFARHPHYAIVSNGVFFLFCLSSITCEFVSCLVSVCVSCECECARVLASKLHVRVLWSLIVFSSTFWLGAIAPLYGWAHD